MWLHCVEHGASLENSSCLSVKREPDVKVANVNLKRLNRCCFYITRGVIIKTRYSKPQCPQSNLQMHSNDSTEHLDTKLQFQETNGLLCFWLPSFVIWPFLCSLSSIRTLYNCCQQDSLNQMLHELSADCDRQPSESEACGNFSNILNIHVCWVHPFQKVCRSRPQDDYLLP